jgi:hypothetical protein
VNNLTGPEVAAKITQKSSKHLTESPENWSQTTDLDIVDSAIHGVVCQKSDFHGNSNIQNPKKLDPLENKSKKI